MDWRVGVSTGAWVGQDIGRALDAIEQAGFHAIEVGTPPGHFDPWNIDQVHALASRMAASGITPVSIHAPFGGLLELSDPNPHHRHAAVGGIVAAASALRQLGGSIVVAHTTDVPRDGQDVPSRLANCASALSVLARSCEQMHMTLAIENPLPHLIGGHPDEFGWILAHVGSAARVCLDTSHATLGNHLDGLLEVIGDRVVHVHANDHHGTCDAHLSPGSGIVPWPRIGAHLRRVRFDGWLILELNRDISSSPELLAAGRVELIRCLGPTVGVPR
jgi:sugar phosphate isomerase/epimerase